MSVGVVLVTHDDVGEVILKAAVSALDMCPLPVEVLAVTRGDSPEAMVARAQELVEKVSQGDGVLVITDIYGSTPSNIASALQQSMEVKAIAGLNLPMLIKVFNYPKLNLDDLLSKALDGGREGIMRCEAR